jgi:hypothetical protein
MKTAGVRPFAFACSTCSVSRCVIVAMLDLLSAVAPRDLRRGAGEAASPGRGERRAAFTRRG